MRTRRALLAALVATASATLGALCDPPPRATLALVPSAASVAVGQRFTVAIRATQLGGALQAFDLAVSAPPESLELIAASPHPEFDDDGALTVAPQLDAVAGTLVRIVDFRHGGAGAGAPVVLAEVELEALAAGSAEIRLVEPGLATPGGRGFAVTHAPVSVTLVP